MDLEDDATNQDTGAIGRARDNLGGGRCTSGLGGADARHASGPAGEEKATKKDATHAQANAYLEACYLPEDSRRFARAAARPEDYHRRAPSATELDRIFRQESERPTTRVSSPVKRKWVPPADHPWRLAAGRGAEKPASSGPASSLALSSASP